MNVSRLIKLAGHYGGYALARAITAGHPRLLMYHRFCFLPHPGHVSADEFEQHVRYVARHFNAVTVSQIALALYEGKPLPRKSIAITIDDGYRDFYTVAWPILKKYKIPATFYVTTGFVNEDLWLWPDQLRYLLERAPVSDNRFDFGPFSVETPLTERNFEACYWRINQILLKADNAEKLSCLKSMERAWKIDLPTLPPEEYRAVSWDQLREMQDEGLEVGGHTVTHPSLARVTMEEARGEILGCSEALNHHLGDSLRSFCYPNGTPEDFVGDQVTLIQEAGFTCAAVAFADSQEHKQRYAMRRHASSSDQFQFLKAVSGIELLGMKWRKAQRETPYE